MLTDIFYEWLSHCLLSLQAHVCMCVYRLMHTAVGRDYVGDGGGGGNGEEVIDV